MKLIRSITLASLVLILMQSCQTQSDQKVYLHLQGGFSGDDVRINIDGTEVYHNDSVVTNNLLGVADIDSTIQASGNHQIKVDVNNGFIQTENFDLQHTLYLGINLNPTDSTISIQYSSEPYLYE